MKEAATAWALRCTNLMWRKAPARLTSPLLSKLSTSFLSLLLKSISFAQGHWLCIFLFYLNYTLACDFFLLHSFTSNIAKIKLRGMLGQQSSIHLVHDETGCQDSAFVMETARISESWCRLKIAHLILSSIAKLYLSCFLDIIVFLIL